MDEFDNPTQKTIPTMAAVAVGLIFGAIMAGAILLLQPAKDEPIAPVQANPAVADKQPRMTRPEFLAKVMGKTEAEVLAAIGRPEKTTGNPGDLSWWYRNQTTDPVSLKDDPTAVVWFKNGVVWNVLFTNY